MYAMICTHTNLSYALNMVSQFQGNPSRAHWNAVKNILKYMRSTKDMVLVLGGNDTLRVDIMTPTFRQIDTSVLS